MKLILATNNAHKAREFREILGNRFDDLVTLREAGIEHETVEDGVTFAENALKKAREICEMTGCAAIADDSGLCVDALDGEPGILSARYASLDGKDASDRANLDLLKRNMEGVENRAARYVCAIALVLPDGRVFQTEDTFEGEIGVEEKGQNGFGYDPIFYVPAYGTTAADMAPELKNSLSHRGKALRAMEAKLANEAMFGAGKTPEKEET